MFATLLIYLLFLPMFGQSQAWMMERRLRMLLITIVKQFKSIWPSQKESNYKKFNINYTFIFSGKVSIWIDGGKQFGLKVLRHLQLLQKLTQIFRFYVAEIPKEHIWSWSNWTCSNIIKISQQKTRFSDLSVICQETKAFFKEIQKLNLRRNILTGLSHLSNNSKCSRFFR